MHHYSVLYMMHGLLGGLIYSVAFYLKRNSSPLLMTAAIHSLYNLFAFIYNYL